MHQIETDRCRLPWYVLAAFVGLAIACAAAIYIAVEDKQSNLSRINEGRALALNVICAYGSAISEAGREVIAGSAREPLTPREKLFERNLQRLGYPPLGQRRQAARLGGAAYVENINRRVEERTGIEGLVIRKGPRAGSLNCDKLQRAAEIK